MRLRKRRGTMGDLNLLPGVPEEYVRQRLAAAGGKEVESGKFTSRDSSAALAVNAFAWFHDRPGRLPVIPETEAAGWPATRVEVEYCARFPWRGGRHPWLDALIQTPTHILGVESKRHEPFRDAKKVCLSEAYDRPVWGVGMGPYERMRDRLRSGEAKFQHLDAAQLVKHAFGLVTEAGRKDGRKPVLLYLYDEPSRWPWEGIELHRQEVDQFGTAVDDAAVGFVAVRWRDWPDGWAATGDPEVIGHGVRLGERFGLDVRRT